MPQRILDCLDLFGRAGMILMLFLFNSIRGFVHIQSNHALDLDNISPISLMHWLWCQTVIRMYRDC